MTLSNFLKSLLSKFTRRSYSRSTQKQYVSDAILKELKKGIKKGEGIPKLAKRVQGVSNRNRRNAITVARTETTRIQNTARMDSFERAEKLNIAVDKEWVATSDSCTRDSHAAMDGQIVALDEPFISGDGNELMQPGDSSAPAEDVIKCRCTVAAKLRE